MRARLACGLVALAILGLVGCGEDGPDTDPTHQRGPTPSTAPSAPPSTAYGRTHHALDTQERDVRAPSEAPRSADPRAAAALDPSAAGPTPPPSSSARDLGAELAASIGSPATCIDLATARSLHGTLTIGVTAQVTPAGNVTRATVSASSLPEAAVHCIEQRALAAHVGSPVEGAPRSVSTSLRFEITATDDTVTHETPEWHQPGQVAAPGIVLPAQAPTGPASGAVQPDSVLPAVGATGRPEGSVQPDIVLPARAQ